MLIFIGVHCKSPAGVSGKKKTTTTEPQVANAAQKIEKITANGLTFNYIEAGNGTPVILIHGSVSDFREWTGQINSLSRDHHVIAYSRRYHWPNDPADGNADASLDKQVEDLYEIIKAMKSGPAHIVGHSFGGAVALVFTLRYPELVRSLVLAEPAVSGVLDKTPENDAVLKESQAIRSRMKEVITTGNAELIVKTYAAHVAPGDFEKAIPEDRNMLLENSKAFQLDFNSQRTPFTCNDAKKIIVPVLILAGEQSPTGLQRIAELTATCIPGGKFIKIPQATHWLQHDQPEEFNDAVVRFLAAIK